MKTLYVKFNSERNPAFALKTTIYQQDSIKFVSKEALTEDAYAHILRIQNAYELLADSLQNDNFQPIEILSSSKDKIIFPFLEGISFEEKFLELKNDPKALQEFWNQYETLIKNSFSTTTFSSSTMVNEELKELFGFIDYTQLDGLLCFNGVSNLDLIFSNIFQTEDQIYILDYEWTYPLHIPVDYVLYRTKHFYETTYNISFNTSTQNDILFEQMDRHFIDKYIMRNSFYNYKKNYIKINTPVQKHIQIKETHISQLEARQRQLQESIKEINNKLGKTYEKLDETGRDLTYARKIIELRDKQIASLGLKNRIKRLIKKLLPGFQVEQDPLKEDIKYEDLFSESGGAIYNYKSPEFTQEIEQTIEKFSQKPLLSIIMPVYNVDPKWLQKAIESVQKQWYKNWELCIIDDKSTNQATIQYLQSLNDKQIKIKFSDINKNIAGASNDAAAMAEGEYILLLDNDDEFTPDALYEMVKKINETDSDFIYSDEDFVDTNDKYSNPHFKPDFSPDLLLSHNYITHLSCFKRSLFEEVGRFDERFSGSQDYDLFLRMSEKAQNVVHIPKVLYHWRTLESSTSANSKAKPEALELSKKVLEETLKRRGIEGWLEHGNIDHYFRVRYTIKNDPLVSIIIPFKDKPELLEMCVNSILEKTTYTNFELIGISNNSQEQKTFDLMQEFQKKDTRIHFYEYNIPFNYAKINNYAVEHYAKGEHILLLNNDIEVITPDWIESMLEHSQRKEIGCVGAKLYYPDDTIQHAGIIMGLGGYAGHSHKMLERENLGYFNRLHAIQNLSAVTAACLMVKTSIYHEINGMDDENFKVAYNDVDFCLRVMEKGYKNLFTPYAEMYHHESVSRGYETTPEKIARFDKEKEALYNRHKEILKNGDPYYNPNLTHAKEDFSICPL